jgi:hypothetical protein
MHNDKAERTYMSLSCELRLSLKPWSRLALHRGRPGTRQDKTSRLLSDVAGRGGAGNRINSSA